MQGAEGNGADGPAAAGPLAAGAAAFLDLWEALVSEHARRGPILRNDEDRTAA